MPGKSRKQRYQAKKRRSQQSSSSVPVREQTPAPAVKPYTQPERPHPVRGSAPNVAITTARYPYVVAELRRIGILAGVIVVILIVLALVLP